MGDLAAKAKQLFPIKEGETLYDDHWKVVIHNLADQLTAAHDALRLARIALALNKNACEEEAFRSTNAISSIDKVLK